MRRRSAITLAAVMLVVVGCSDNGGGEPLDLGDPTTQSDDPTDGEVDDGQPGDGDDGTPGDDGEVAVELPEPAYPPLPDFEPDPDSDLTEDEQREAHNIYAEAYDAMQRSLAIAELDPRAQRLFAGDALEELSSAIETLQERGLVSLNPTMEILSTSYHRVDEGSLAVRQCREFNDGNGRYDRATGEPSHIAEPGIALVSFLVEVGSDGQGRITDTFIEDGDELCREDPA